MLNEHILHFIWKFRLFPQEQLILENKESLTILSPGRHNGNAGPDFQDARLMIGSTLWAGNVEIHVRSSDWYRHHHQHDASYNNIILHVVAEHDAEVADLNQLHVPVLVIKPLISQALLQRWNALNGSMFPIPCAALGRPDVLTIRNWLDRLIVERMEEKTKRIKQILQLTKNDWQETLYCFLFRSMGMQLNAVPFELLARSVPYRLLMNYRQSRFQLEAILFGQSGLLPQESEEEYVAALITEYQFLKRKHRLQPMDAHLWKFLRLRPINFPTVRIAQLADMLSRYLFSPEELREMKSIKEMMQLFDVEVSPFWEEHFVFQHPSSKQMKRLGKVARQNLMINAVLPFLFVYATHRGDELLRERSLELLYSLPAEKNLLMREWNLFGIQPSSAAESQGLLQLKAAYCDTKKCLDCAVGHRLLKGN
ncbi:MAG: hypothetical protein RLZZ543_1433 [Bacteroidota bacterium]